MRHGPQHLVARQAPAPDGSCARRAVALGLLLTNPACQADASLRQLMLERAYAGWWRGLGLSDYLEGELILR
jgi:hypothetical protein